MEVEFRLWPEVVGLETPGNFKRVEIVGVDLVERGVASVAEIAAVGSPLSGLGGALAGEPYRRQPTDDDEDEQRQHRTA